MTWNPGQMAESRQIWQLLWVVVRLQLGWGNFSMDFVFFFSVITHPVYSESFLQVEPGWLDVIDHVSMVFIFVLKHHYMSWPGSFSIMSVCQVCWQHFNMSIHSHRPQFQQYYWIGSMPFDIIRESKKSKMLDSYCFCSCGNRSAFPSASTEKSLSCVASTLGSTWSSGLNDKHRLVTNPIRAQSVLKGSYLPGNTISIISETYQCCYAVI